MAAPLTRSLEIRDGLLAQYPDVLTAEVLMALEHLAPFDEERRGLMAARLARRKARAAAHQPLTFLPPA